MPFLETIRFPGISLSAFQRHFTPIIASRHPHFWSMFDQRGPRRHNSTFHDECLVRTTHSMYWHPQPTKNYRITLVYPSGFRKPLDGNISLARALQIKAALRGIFSEILIEELPSESQLRRAA